MREIMFGFYLIFLVSCSSINYPGMYKYSRNGNDYVRILKLKQDSTFEYSHSYGLIEEESKGQWIAKNNILQINSNSIYNTGTLEVKQLDDSTGSDSLLVQVISKFDRIPLQHVAITLNHKETSYTNEYGQVFFSRFKKITSVKVEYHDIYLSEIEILLKEKKIEVLLIEKDLSKRYFNNENWKIKGKTLINPDGLIFKKMN